jgi:hypothetical protein
MRLKFLSACTLAAVTSLYGLSAQATTITIDFDSGTLAGGVYTQGIFQATPVNIQNSTQCATGACTQEAVGQGLITTLTRTDGLAFDLDGFYFALEGNGQGALNDVTITDTSPGGSTSFNYKMGDKDTNGHLSYYLGVALNPFVDVIDKSTGANGPFYVANYSTEFDGVTSITWYGGSTAKTRIDNFVVTYEDPNSGPGPSPVPLPAGGILLLTGLAGLGAAARRRKRK